MKTNQISFSMEGPADRDGHLVLDAFVASLGDLRDSLKRADRLLHHGELSADFRIVDLQHSSPATVVVEEVPRQGPEVPGVVVPAYLQAIEAIKSGKTGPARGQEILADHEILTKLRRVSSRVRLNLSDEHRTWPLDEAFRANLDRMLAPAVRCFDSIVGRVLAIDLSRGVFFIFPDVGPDRIRAHVPEGKKAEVISALDQYVRVSGIVSFTRSSPHPTGIIVEELEVIDDSAAPTLMDLRGMISKATGSLSSEELIRRLRDEW